MTTLNDLYKAASFLPNTRVMPILFVGHGSPMNAIENNEFTKDWSKIGLDLPNPNAIVCISAHWETRGTQITANDRPRTIHDFYGFPKELYQVEYPADGYPELANTIISNSQSPIIEASYDWGIDHGAWSVLKFLYPEANIPIIQISMDLDKSPEWHYQLGAKLAYLRTKGVLIIGSGNMIHNLRMIKLNGEDFNSEYGYDWAFELNEIFKQKILSGDISKLIHYNSLHRNIRLAIPTAEHYIPLLYILGMKEKNENIKFFNDRVIAGSLSMTSVLIGGHL